MAGALSGKLYSFLLSRIAEWLDFVKKDDVGVLGGQLPGSRGGVAWEGCKAVCGPDL